MKMFRSHIARVSGFLMLMIGMVLHYAKPADSKTDYSAFTSWLESHLKTPDHTVLDELEALSSDNGELETVIRKASELVHTHSDDFKLPVSEGDDERTSKEDVYQLLLTQWNNYQNSGSGMGKAVFIQNIKPQTILPSDGHHFSSALNKRTLRYDVDEVSDIKDYELTSGNASILSPHKSGTAIGAP